VPIRATWAPEQTLPAPASGGVRLHVRDLGENARGAANLLSPDPGSPHDRLERQNYRLDDILKLPNRP
jgi:hypothetical protein